MQNNSENETPRSRVFNESIEYSRRKQFSDREVGITHPDNSGFMRISDSGEIEIFAAPGVGLIINPNTRSISLYADSIKFYSREDDGLRWNEKSFNPASDVYNEPTFLKTNDFLNNPAYYRSTYYLDNLNLFDQGQDQNALTIIGNYGLGLDQDQNSPVISASENSEITNLTIEQKKLVDNYAINNPQEKVDLLVSFLSVGYTFQQALEKIDDGDLNNPNFSEGYLDLKNDQER
jgi:hypothetical protein